MIRLKTHIWTASLLRRVAAGGASAFVTQKGDADAGSVYIKVSRLNGEAVLYSPALTADMSRAWRADGPKPEAEIDAAIKREARFDPDIWVIEIEDKQGRHFLTEPFIEL